MVFSPPHPAPRTPAPNPIASASSMCILCSPCRGLGSGHGSLSCAGSCSLGALVLQFPLPVTPPATLDETGLGPLQTIHSAIHGAPWIQLHQRLLGSRVSPDLTSLSSPGALLTSLQVPGVRATPRESLPESPKTRGRRPPRAHNTQTLPQRNL